LNINEDDNTFDAILCTEVFEHIPYPIETLKEFNRLLKVNGRLILTAPSNCLRHMDPYIFYTGFTDRWYEFFLKENGFKINYIEPIGDYYRWVMVEIVRTAITHSLIAKVILFPAFLYFYNKKKTQLSVNTLCIGYHIIATKI
jgi:ubiquinone/menaquinone biosynthesis C-methylase UbiE